MTRSKWKADVMNSILLQKCLQNKKKRSKQYLYIMDKATIILPFFKDKIINIYNGQKFIPKRILAGMVGHKFGEFIFTRLYRKKIVKQKKQKKK